MIIFDASTLIGAAVFSDSIPQQALDKARGCDTFALSDPISDEIMDVFYRVRLARFVKPRRRTEILDIVFSDAVWFDPNTRVYDCRDGKDNKYLELTLAASVSTIVSSDNDLLVLHPWRSFRILRPAEYLATETA